MGYNKGLATIGVWVGVGMISLSNPQYALACLIIGSIWFGIIWLK